MSTLPPFPVDDGTLDVQAQAAADGYAVAVAVLRGVAERTGSNAARWAAEYLEADPDRQAPTNAQANGIAAPCCSAAEEVTELRHLFDLQWKRMGEATDRWRAEDPEARALSVPDLGDLLKWLMDDADRARTAAGSSQDTTPTWRPDDDLAHDIRPNPGFFAGHPAEALPPPPATTPEGP